MLRASISSRPLTVLSRPAFTLPACRTFASGVVRFNARRETASTDFKGSEGMHKHNNAKAAPRPTETEVKGDWVSFHPVYSPEELKAVEVYQVRFCTFFLLMKPQVFHREANTLSDKVAVNAVKFFRWIVDTSTRYKHKPIPPQHNMSLTELKKGGYVLDENQWLTRILFLETIAGVPGMVAGPIRHLRSLRLMKRDAGWINTLLEEAENERMHLMTFMTLRQPGIFLRTMVLGAQGFFYNLFFWSYLVSPRTCHRFVGFLEEEAVLTYTRIIEELESGHLPEWSDKPAPEIAINYWRLRPDAKLLNVIYAVRSDESTHRFINHTLANLNYAKDLNPFAIREPDMTVKGKNPGFTREESVEYIRESQDFTDGPKSS